MSKPELYKIRLPFNLWLFTVIHRIKLELGLGFKMYLIDVGIRSLEFTYSDVVLFENIKHFRKCYKQNLSAYKALLFLHDEINAD